jgi:hypothetical protein
VLTVIALGSLALILKSDILDKESEIVGLVYVGALPETSISAGTVPKLTVGTSLAKASIFVALE